MRKIKLLFVSLLCLALMPVSCTTKETLEKKIETIKEVAKVETLTNSANFKEKYLLYFTQPIDPDNPEKGTFTQRVTVAHAGFDRPTVIVTAGYGAAYALKSDYRTELSEFFDANMIVVEHRYFLESTPEPRDWQYLTAKNSAIDLHNIREAFKDIYPEKWISTGISKGGQSTMIYLTYFPQDVDIWVPYVGPVCNAVEDGRHEPFLRNVSTAENREKIQDFQLEVLKRRESLMPKFKTLCEEKEFEFNVDSLDEIFDYCALEYSFAFWQWGSDVSKIPANTADDDVVFEHFTSIAGPSYFSRGSNLSFFVQALKELGYYGYDIEPFKEYLSIKSSKNYLSRLMIPKDIAPFTFDPGLSLAIHKHFAENDPKVMFIYGEIDPWTAAGITSFENKENMKLFIQPGGNHLTRISTMPDEMKNEAIDILTKWLEK